MDDEMLDRITGGAALMNAPEDLQPAPPASAYDSDGYLRKPPHSVEAEQGLLGGLMLDNAQFAKVSETLGVGDFYAYQHKLIYSAIAELIGTGKPADVVTVFEQLGDLAEKAGGLSYVNAVAQGVATAANVPRYAEIIIERATRRAVIAAASIAVEQAYSTEGSAAQLIDDAKVSFARIAEQRKVGTAQRMPIMNLGQLREHSHAISWLIKHVIPADSLGMMYGGSGTFKSFIAVDAALHVAHGLPWMGRKTKQGTVLYIAAEGGAGLWARIAAWHRTRRIQYGDNVPFHVLPVAVDLVADAWRVVEAAQALGITPDLVVVDTLSQTYSGEENSANEMAAYFREIGNRFRALWHCAVMLLHHTGHNATERPRGSSAIRANLDWMLGVHRDEKELLATLSCAKQKDGDAFDDATFSMLIHELGTDEDGDRITSLVARHLSSAEELQEAMDRETSAGRGGHNQALLSLLQNGCKEADLRKAFGDQTNLTDADSRKRAYNRAKAWVIKHGFAEFSGGYVITLKNGG